ncbi:probable methyltransferase-like protein 24 [Argopecten irradians]|uniref:probable methyltransferase-like protein 24 n=1 Tax=Argopecten irradians TaxID=31199 RepID=UPI00370F7EC8
MKSKSIIDYMAIDIEEGETSLLSWMLERDLLRNVHQLLVNYHGLLPDSDASVYTEHLQVLRALFEEGFRIFHFIRDVQCLFKPNMRQTGCYSLNMIRNLPKSPPIDVYDVETTLNKPIRDLSILYNRLLLSTQVHCKQLVRIGDVNDGGWEVCDDPEYRPSPSCLVYSFGVDNDWTFDDEVSKVYGCEVHSFDPSIGLQDHKRSDKITFHNLGLWDRPKGKLGKWNMMNMAEIIEMLGHKGKIIDILKMDIEGMEFDVISNMITSGVVKNIRQLDFEFHGGPDFKETDDIRSKLKPLRDLHEHGFRIFWSHPNVIGKNVRPFSVTGRQLSRCNENYFLNTNLKRT